MVDCHEGEYLGRRSSENTEPTSSNINASLQKLHADSQPISQDTVQSEARRMENMASEFMDHHIFGKPFFDAFHDEVLKVAQEYGKNGLEKVFKQMEKDTSDNNDYHAIYAQVAGCFDRCMEKSPGTVQIQIYDRPAGPPSSRYIGAEVEWDGSGILVSAVNKSYLVGDTSYNAPIALDLSKSPYPKEAEHKKN